MPIEVGDDDDDEDNEDGNDDDDNDAHHPASAGKPVEILAGIGLNVH